MRALPLLLIVLLFSATPLFAQLKLTPVGGGGQVPAAASTRPARTKATPLSLPFFDDFSASTLTPTDSLWINGGVVINNQFVQNPPSKGVATFDGLKFSGEPYIFDNTIVQSATDTLISRPINLDKLSPGSNVALSFYWQAQGLGERPDPGDSLVLQFKTKDNAWRRVWSQRGETVSPTMKDTVFAITNTDFLHDAFQFRFLMYGRPSGVYDVWHIDYVYLNKDRDPNRKDAVTTGSTTTIYDNPYQRFIKDNAVSRPLKSLLKRYTAMPFEQYNVNPAGELIIQDTVFANYLYLIGFNDIPLIYTITDLANNNTLFSFQRPIPNDPAPAFRIFANRPSPFYIPIPSNTIPAANGPRTLKTTFSIQPRSLEEDIKGVDLRVNDTISTTTVLDDYYAYDDGSAEYGIYMTQQLGQVAVRYVLNKPGAITAVNVYFPKLGTNLRGETFVLKIWKKLDNQGESVLFQRSYPVRYTDTLNKFTTYKLLDRDNLETSVAVTDTFYVGWQQPSGGNIIFGYDINTNSKGQQFFNITGDNAAKNWGTADQQAGSIMIRPVFGQVPLGVEEEPETVPVPAASGQIFPNPTRGPVSWTIPGISRIRVYDVLGRLVKEAPAPATASIDIGHLPEGMYVIHLQKGPSTFVRKIILRR